MFTAQAEDGVLGWLTIRTYTRKHPLCHTMTATTIITKFYVFLIHLLPMAIPNLLHHININARSV